MFQNGDNVSVSFIGKMKKVRSIFIFFLAYSYANAQERPKIGEWFAVNLPLNFTKQWQWHNDAGYRTLGTSFDPLQYLFRTGFRYNFNKQWSTAAGVAFFFTKTDFDKTHHEFGREFRFWEEVNHLYPMNKKLQLLLRFRAEQRFFDATSVKAEYTGYRFRLRPGINQRLDNRWSLQLTDEYMMQVANQKCVFDQNRLTFSGIYQFNKTAQLQGGYMWLKWANADQHIFTFTFTKIISLYGD